MRLWLLTLRQRLIPPLPSASAAHTLPLTSTAFLQPRPAPAPTTPSFPSSQFPPIQPNRTSPTSARRLTTTRRKERHRRQGVIPEGGDGQAVRLQQWIGSGSAPAGLRESVEDGHRVRFDLEQTEEGEGEATPRRAEARAPLRSALKQRPATFPDVSDSPSFRSYPPRQPPPTTQLPPLPPSRPPTPSMHPSSPPPTSTQRQTYRVLSPEPGTAEEGVDSMLLGTLIGSSFSRAWKEQRLLEQQRKDEDRVIKLRK